MSSRIKLFERICEIMSANSGTEAVRASEYAMDPPNATVGYRTKIQLNEVWLRLDVSVASARPPFEWIGEVTMDSKMGLEHYLVREDDVVRAVRKTITPLNEAEIKSIIDNLKLIEVDLKESGLWQPGAFTLTY